MDTEKDTFCDEHDLVRLLVLEAGRLMEDASPDFAMALPSAASERMARLTTMRDAVAAGHALMKAAAALETWRHCPHR
jgi:hypothetical protein